MPFAGAWYICAFLLVTGALPAAFSQLLVFVVVGPSLLRVELLTTTLALLRPTPRHVTFPHVWTLRLSLPLLLRTELLHYKTIHTQYIPYDISYLYSRTVGLTAQPALGTQEWVGDS